MTLSLYDISVPALIRGLDNLSHLIARAGAHAEQHGMDPAELVRARLAPTC